MSKLETRYLTVESHQQIAKLLNDLTVLRGQILVCCTELSALSLAQQSITQGERIRDLNDTIFGHRIEIQSLKLKIDRIRQTLPHRT